MKEKQASMSFKTLQRIYYFPKKGHQDSINSMQLLKNVCGSAVWRVLCKALVIQIPNKTFQVFDLMKLL